MAASFVLKKKAFEFSLEEEPEVVYTIPATSRLSYEDADLMVRIQQEEDIAKRGEMVEEFINKYAPEIAEKDIGGMGYYSIFQAYVISQEGDSAKPGES